MRRGGLLLACLATIPAGTALGARPSSDQSLRAFLQARFHDDRDNYPDARYVSAWADLDGDSHPEAFVYLISGAYCGSGGCNLMIFTPAGGAWREVADMSVTHPPIRLLDTATHGWRDIAVTVAGGGARAHEVVMAFNGRAYPDNPTVPPARALRRTAPGRVLITDGDRGRPLF
jgi:hypothetical protein